jgi:hypothetical protein
MFHQQNLAFAQNGNLISEGIQRTADPSTGANWAAGKIINAGSAVAMPMAGLGLGMMGLDPMSMAFRGGMSAFGGNMGRAAMWGAGALGMSGVMAAGSYVAGQLHEGMGQQQQFNQMMGQSFRFMTPNGQGFTNQQMGVMGQQLRSMSGQIGPAGEMVGFGELSSLAANMGKMGLGSGVRDVQEFGRKFREMVDTAKTMARELGTTLEGAQQAMAQMRNSGVFRASDQLKMSGEMRNYSLGGNVSMASLYQMGGMGAQLSRAIGGRGRAGFEAGVRTLGNVGMAVESGVLSEEDIYNATGLTGEEGKQAMAASQLQSSAAWLRGGKGRRFLASIAGAGGKLDAASVNAWMSGDMGTGSTMSQAYGNLGKMDLADFIRNEGRLRGEALSQFGGNIPAMALMQWAGQRGIDINNMDDRSMLFAQRHTGLGMDELENAVKMIRNAPEMQSQGRMTRMSDARRQEMAGLRRNTGMEGVKRNLEHMRETVQGKLQGIGQQMYSDLTSMVEDTLNEMGGTIIQQVSADIDKSYQGLLKGDKTSAGRLGVGNSKAMAGAKARFGGQTGSFGSGINAEAFDKKLPFGTSMRDRVTASGFGGLFGKGSDFNASIKSLEGAARGMGNLGDKEAMGLGGGLSSELNSAYAGGISTLKGQERLEAVRAFLQKKGGADAERMHNKLFGDTDATFSALASMEAGMGLTEKARVGAVSGLPEGIGLLGGSGMSQNERIKSYGRMTTGKNDKDGQLLDRFTKGAAGLGGALGAAAMVGGGILAPLMAPVAAMAAGGSWLAGKMGGKHLLSAMGFAQDPGETDSRGQYLVSRDGQDTMRSILTGTDMSKSLENRINGITGDSDDAKRQRSMFKGMLATNNMLREEQRLGRKLTDKEREAVEDKAGATRGSAIGFGQAGYKAVTEQANLDRREALMMYGKGAAGEVQQGQAVGYLDKDGRLSEDAKSSFAKAAGAKGLELATKMASLKRVQASGARTGLSDDETEQIAGSLEGRGASIKDAMYGMGIGDLRKLAAAERAAGNFDAAEQLGQVAGSRARGEASLARGGNIAAARMLGLKVGQGDAMAIHGFGGEGGGGKLAAYLGHQFGVGSLKGIDKELDELNRGQSTEETEKRKADLISQRALASKFSALEGEKDVAKRNKIISDITESPEFKEKEHKKQEEKNANDPMIQGLKSIADAVKALGTGPLATIASNTAGGTPGGAAQPGQPAGGAPAGTPR